MTRLSIGLLATVAALQTAEPAPRKATPMPLQIAIPLAHVSAAHELADGRILISDAKNTSVSVLDPKTGALTRVGSAGVGPDQYVQPGGFYRGQTGTTLLLDRAQQRVMRISPKAEFTGTYSIARKGEQSSSSADHDLQRLDARGFAYFTDRAAVLDRAGMGTPAPLQLVRFEPNAQRRDIVAELRRPETKTIQTSPNSTISRSVTGSPADGWGVAPDGRVAVVRGQPYRVDWISPTGAITRGPDIAVDPIPMTQADRDAFIAASAARGGGASVGLAGGAPGGGGIEPMFAATKAPFSPDDVIVSPDAQVWVPRSRPFGATTVVVDVFDARGQRIDRVELPEKSRIVGFGSGALYVWNGTTLLKYARRADRSAWRADPSGSAINGRR